jgi:uncharacterized protein
LLERDGYPPGVPCWVDTGRLDPEAVVGFYGGLFGWEFEDRMPAEAPGHYFVAQLRGRDVAAVGSLPVGAPQTPAWNTYVWVDSADETAAKAQEAGGRVIIEPYDVPGAGRMAMLADREGATFSVLQSQGHKGAQVVNEPGSWVFSELNTRDAEGAQAFYGAVFGWETTAMGDGAGMMWRRPGYGDFLEQRDPELRERQAADGAPPGFEDAVAWLVPMTAEQFPADVAPHWSITFSVSDADASAAKAAELGGKVLVPPFDAPWIRMAVVSDPQGARFTVSRYSPPS